MRDYPIIFSGAMVRALLEGRKTMTRRLAFRDGKPGSVASWVRDRKWVARSPWQRVKPGDRLWVRETWRGHHDAGGVIHDAAGGQMDYIEPEDHIEYRAACKHPANFKWCSPLHLPRTHSRLTLNVTATKIERLNRISNADAIAEGCGVDFDHPIPELTREPFPAERFRDLWKKLHGVEAWDVNPEVVALSFTVHKSNIDAGSREPTPC